MYGRRSKCRRRSIFFNLFRVEIIFISNIAIRFSIRLIFASNSIVARLSAADVSARRIMFSRSNSVADNLSSRKAESF